MEKGKNYFEALRVGTLLMLAGLRQMRVDAPHYLM
jgi:hypothetical protein